jgi:hypothetical protein
MRQRIQRLGHRLNWPLVFALLIVAYLVYHLVPILHCYQTGKAAVAEVVRYAPQTDDEGRRIHHYEFAFDGHHVVKRFGRLRDIGEKFPVTYLPDRPASVIKGAKPDSIASIIDQNTNDVGLAITAAVATLLLISGALKWRAERRRRSEARAESVSKKLNR